MPDRMRELVDRINQLNYHYYVLDDPIASDDEWDALYRELVLLEQSQGRVLEDYRVLDTGLYQLTYSGGVQLLVNQTAQDMVISGQTVDAGSFTILS